MKKEINGDVTIDKGLYNLITESANNQRQAIDTLSYINHLPVLRLKSYESSDFVNNCKNHINDFLKPIIIQGDRTLSLNISSVDLKNPINIDIENHKKILNELVFNAIKYSLEGSKIYMEIFKDNIPSGEGLHYKTKEVILIKVRNIPRESSLKDNNYNKIVGIPYDYSEIIFDLFYTMESFEMQHDDEEWSHGTGLFISRRLAQRMDCWIDCKNITDFRNGEKNIYVEFNYIIPSSTTRIELEEDSDDVMLF